MTRIAVRPWWLLALCGLLEAAYALVNLVMQDPEGSLTWRTFAAKSTTLLLGRVAIAAGACAVLASFRSGQALLLLLNGAAMATFGVMCLFAQKAISFRVFALLIVVMALSLGAILLRRGLGQFAAVVSAGFATAFVVLGFRWIRPQQPETLFVWMSAYFAFSAICMLWMSYRTGSSNTAIPAAGTFNSPLPR